MYSSDEIKKQLKQLLILKRSGELDDEEKHLLDSNNEYWRGSVTYDCLERYVCHHDEEVFTKHGFLKSVVLP